ncbi:hypothetical protein IAT40_006514 [Kwoniella sp. CBS 6097]
MEDLPAICAQAEHEHRRLLEAHNSRLDIRASNVRPTVEDIEKDIDAATTALYAAADFVRCSDLHNTAFTRYQTHNTAAKQKHLELANMQPPPDTNECTRLEACYGKMRAAKRTYENAKTEHRASEEQNVSQTVGDQNMRSWADAGTGSVILGSGNSIQRDLLPREYYVRFATWIPDPSSFAGPDSVTRLTAQSQSYSDASMGTYTHPVQPTAVSKYDPDIPHQLNTSPTTFKQDPSAPADPSTEGAPSRLSDNAYFSSLHGTDAHGLPEFSGPPGPSNISTGYHSSDNGPVHSAGGFSDLDAQPPDSDVK